MNNADRRLWPFKPRTSIASTVLILVGLLISLVILRAAINWPSDKSEPTVLIGILLISLLPIVLALVDAIIERGGVIKAGGVEINFSNVSQVGMSGFAMPTNIGVSGTLIGDSDTEEILDALKHATACEIVVVDLEDGQAWWETRLLVLLSGAGRLGRPEKIVFTGRDGGIDGCFQGWGYSVKLLPYILKAHPQYLRSYHAARAAGKQWELVEPVNPLEPGNPNVVPLQPTSIQAGLANSHPWMAFNNTTGLPNTLLAEQLLASDLGQNLESKEGPKPISLVRLSDIFQPVLYKTKIDTRWSKERQINEFFDSDFNHFAITQNGKYLSLTSRLSVLNAFVRSGNGVTH